MQTWQHDFMPSHHTKLELQANPIAEQLGAVNELTQNERLPHILVVDDHPDVADALALVIGVASTSPVTTSVAYSGPQAIESAKAVRPDVVLLDVDMPVMNGVEAATAIRKILLEPTPLMMALTGNAQHCESLSARAAFDRIFVKPVDVDLLMNAIRAAE
jgi:CheY-like chemotaxis protein